MLMSLITFIRSRLAEKVPGYKQGHGRLKPDLTPGPSPSLGRFG
jgi:hypothetical protein